MRGNHTFFEYNEKEWYKECEECNESTFFLTYRNFNVKINFINYIPTGIGISTEKMKIAFFNKSTLKK